jgi:hypothetical protein
MNTRLLKRTDVADILSISKALTYLRHQMRPLLRITQSSISRGNSRGNNDSTQPSTNTRDI